MISILALASWYNSLRLVYPLDSPPRAGEVRLRRDIALESASISLTIGFPIGVALFMVGAVSTLPLAILVSIAAGALTFPLAYFALSHWLRGRGGLRSAQQ